MNNHKQLSKTDRRNAFLAATRTFAKAGIRWRHRSSKGLTDAELEDALRYELGIFGGRSTENCPSIIYQSAGLKIWAGWHSFNHYQKIPIFEGLATIKMAREIYGIKDPSNCQLDLF